MNAYQLASVIVALGLYIPLARKILDKNSNVTQNLASYILWGTLDLIAGTSMFILGSGNYQLPFAYVLGCLLIIWSVCRSGKYNWTKFETQVTLLVIFSVLVWFVVVWVYKNSWLATILSTLGVGLAGIPQLKDALKKPEESPVVVYAGYTIANLLSVVGGKSWTVEERFYSGACSILCATIFLVSLRKYRGVESRIQWGSW